MARFILIDQALVGLGGHFYEFDRNVLDAAAVAGLEPVLACHQKCSLMSCGSWPVLPVYRDGLWTHDQSRLHSKLLGRAVSLARRIREHCRRGRVLADIHSSAQRRIWRLADRQLAALMQLRDRDRATRFATDTIALLEKLQPTADDHIFLPNMLHADTLGIELTLQGSALAQCPTWHLEYHVNLYPGSEQHNADYYAEARLMRRALQQLQQRCSPARVNWYTDTEPLTEQHNELDVCLFRTLPIPVDPAFAPLETELHVASAGTSHLLQPTASRHLKIAFVGGARLEKGFLQLEALIHRIRNDDELASQVEFIVQANCSNTWGQRATWNARKRLAELPASYVTIVPDVLSTDDYRRLVCQSDLIILPYSATEYEARSSGIFAEALCAGVPTVVTRGTWMAKELERAQSYFRSDIVAASCGAMCATPNSAVGVISDNDAEAFVVAVGQIARNYQHFRSTALSYAQPWMARHHAGQLVSTLLAMTDEAIPSGSLLTVA